MAPAGDAKDPKEILLIKKFDAAWNAHNLDAAMSFFADDAVVKLLPPPPDGGVYTGKKQIRGWAEEFIKGFHVDSKRFVADGNKVSWMFTVHSDYIGKMGVNPGTGVAEVLLEKNKIKTFTPTFDQETVGKMVITQFIEEVLNQGNLDAADEFIAANFVDHNPIPGQEPTLEGLKKGFKMFLAAFPDLHLTIEDIIAEGDKVMIRLTSRGTHKGEFMGIPPSGKQVTVLEIHIARIANGKIVEHWGLEDNMGMMQQLGAIPPPGK